MNSTRKFCILLLLSLGMSTSVLAKNIKIEGILADFDAIQVGAFKDKKNILRQNKLLLEYNTFIEYANNLNRLYIVNIQKDDFLRVLAQVKKEHPTAFKATRKIKKILKSSTYTVKKVPRKIEFHDNDFLNSKTILKTRKKFF